MLRARDPVTACDEPTGALDSANGEAVMQILRAACEQGVAGVVVTHNAYLASLAHRTVFMRDGRLVHRPPDRSLPEPMLADPSS